MSPKLIGLIAHTGKPNAAQLVHQLRESFQKKSVTLRMESKSAALIGERSDATTRTLGETCDLLVVLGGDGTLLQVAHDLGEHIKPIFGINLGSLGFLTCVAAADFAKAVDCILAGNFVLSPRTRLCVTVEREGRIIDERTGLNDAVVSRGELKSPVECNSSIAPLPLRVGITETTAAPHSKANAADFTAHSIPVGMAQASRITSSLSSP